MATQRRCAWWFSLASTVLLQAAVGRLVPAAPASELTRIEVREHLGLAYAPQPVHYAVAVPRGALRDPAPCALRDGDGRPVLAQFGVLERWEDGSVRRLRVSFITGAEPGSSRTLVLHDTGPAAADDGTLTLTRQGETLVLASPLVAVEIPALAQAFTAADPQPAVFPPPISRLRGRRGWFGQGRIDLDGSYRLRERGVAVTDDGPVFKRVMVTSSYVRGAPSNTFVGEACLHAVEITLCRGEELVRVRESFSFPFADLSPLEFAFDFHPGLRPDTSVCRPVASAVGPTWDVGSSWDLQPYEGPLFPLTYERDDTLGSLTPWAALPLQWVHFACFRDADGPDADMVGLMITAPERWDHIAYMSAEDSWKLVQNPHAFFTLKKIKDVRLSVGRAPSLTAHFPLTTGTREWAFFVGGPFPRTASREVRKGDTVETKVSQAAPRDWFKNKVNHYAFNPFDRAKDWVLAWPEDPQLAYPHLYGTAAELEARRQRFNASDGERTVPPYDDPAAQAKLKEAVLRQADELVRRMAVNPGPPHHVASAVYPMANLADLLLGTNVLSPAERARLRAQLAFMAYVLNWRGYWAPELGYAANPNMTSFCYDAVGLVGLLLRDHPEAERWIRACTTEIDRELAHWASPDGAWIESPGYVRAAWQEHTMLFAALRQAGGRDYYRDPRVQQFLRYYFTLQTPPHPDRGLQRTLPIIGHVFGLQAVDEFNLWARGLTDVDPALAGALQWMWKEFGFGTAAEMKGKTLYRASGADFNHWFGATLGLPPYKEVALSDPALPVRAPDQPELLRGGRFRGFGAVFNAHYGTRRESKLYLRQGAFYSHWDADQGSIVFWGKGAPLVLDHGYGEFHPWFHSRVNVNHMYDDDLGEVTACFAGDGGAFAQGDMTFSRLSLKEHAWVKEWPFQPEPLNGRALRTDWRRRILFLKDPDPEGPNYLALRDTVAGELPTEWVLWAYGQVADLQATPIRAVGPFGVDLLVYLLDPDKGRVGTGRLDLSQAPAFDPRPAQTLIHLLRPAGRGTLAVLYPVLAQEPPPEVTTLAAGAVVRLKAGTRTDWLFLPETRADLTVDAIRFSGLSGAFSRRGDALYCLADGPAEFAAAELGVAGNAPFELSVTAGEIRGRAGAENAAPVLRLSGPLALRAAVLHCGGRERPLAAVDGQVRIDLPGGTTDFRIVLRPQ